MNFSEKYINMYIFYHFDVSKGFIKFMGWTYSITVIRDVLLDSWHSHCALRSIARVFKSATSNPG